MNCIICINYFLIIESQDGIFVYIHFYFFLCHFLSLILNKCLLARIQEKTLILPHRIEVRLVILKSLLKVTYC